MPLMLAMALGACRIADAGDVRIDLADSARVVRYEGDTPETLQARELERGVDGWEAWKGPESQYMMAIEWDEPRDVAEVNIEFRHAIADRHKVQVQYWRNHWPNSEKGGWARLDDPFHGRWVTAKRRRWWAGDRDVSITFAPFNEENAENDAFSMTWRRTYRLRFLLGSDELPPVRYIRAYGPRPPSEATFDIRFDEKSSFKPPLDATAVNGNLLDKGEVADWVHIPPGDVKIVARYARDDLASPNRTIVTIRDENDPSGGISFLPAEVVKYGIIRVPTMGITIAHQGSRKNLQADLAPGMCIFDRIEAEPEQTWQRARREIPELKKTQQRGRPIYLPLGPPIARQEIAVSYDGSIYLESSALKSKASDSERLHWPDDSWQIRLGSGDPPYDHAFEGNVKQRLLDNYLPIVINSWEHGGIAYEQTSVATYLAGEPKDIRGDETVVLLSRIIASNTSDADAPTVVRLSVEPDEVLERQGQHIRATSKSSDGKRQPYENPQYRFWTDLSATETEVSESALSWSRKLRPGQSAFVEYRVPYVTLDRESEVQQIEGLDFNAVLKHEADRWRRIVQQAAVFDVPDPLLSDFYKAQLTHILITADRDPFNGMHVLPAATFFYNVCLNESCHQIRALDVRGLHGRAERCLQAIIDGQSSRGLHGRFPDKTGVFHGLPTKHGDYQTSNYNLDHGFALWMLNEHYRLTRDRKWLERSADAMIAACDFVTRVRKTATEHNLLGKEDTFWGVGLLPPGHLEDPPEWQWWFAVNAYAYRGMQATAESLTEIDHPQAGRIADDAEAFGQHLRRSCKEAMIRAPVVRLRDGTYVPYQPTRSRLRGRDLGWIRDALYGPVHLIDCGVYPDDSPEAEWILRDAEDNVFIGEDRGRKLEDDDSQWFSWGGITLQSNLLPNPLIYLRRGQPKHAIRAFYNSLAANVFADVRTFCEHPIKAYGIGQGPFFKSPDESAFIVWLRHLLIAEKDDELLLLAGAPTGWFESGKRIRIEKAATWFGPLDVQVVSKSEPQRLEITLNGPTRNPPRAIKLHLRPVGKSARVTVNGEQTEGWDTDRMVLTLPGDISQVQIVASTER